MLLNDLPKYIKCKKKYNIKKTNIQFQSIYSNSKAVKNPSIYIIDEKKKIKQEYIRESIKKGAVALITNKYLKNFFIPQYIVKYINKTKQLLLCKLFRHAVQNLMFEVDLGPKAPFCKQNNMNKYL